MQLQESGWIFVTGLLLWAGGSQDYCSSLDWTSGCNKLLLHHLYLYNGGREQAVDHASFSLPHLLFHSLYISHSLEKQWKFSPSFPPSSVICFLFSVSLLSLVIHTPIPAFHLVGPFHTFQYKFLPEFVYMHSDFLVLIIHRHDLHQVWGIWLFITVYSISGSNSMQISNHVFVRWLNRTSKQKQCQIIIINH